MSGRLTPDNKGNARLLFIEDDKECDICDEIVPCASIDYIGGIYSQVFIICKKCLQEIINRFD